MKPLLKNPCFTTCSFKDVRFPRARTQSSRKNSQIHVNTQKCSYFMEIPSLPPHTNQTEMGPLQAPTLCQVVIMAFSPEKAHVLTTILLCDLLIKPTLLFFRPCLSSSSHSLRSVIFHSWVWLLVSERSAVAGPEGVEKLLHSEFNQTSLDYLQRRWEAV